MENSRLGTRLAALAALTWGSACGGHVVVDGMPDGSGGAGATSASAVSVGVGVTSASAVGVGVTSTSAGWTTTSAVTSSSTGVGGGDAWSMCMGYCELVEENCAPVSPDGCVAECDRQLAEAPECNDLLVPVFECAMPSASRCDLIPAACQPDLQRYAMCASGSGSGCEPLACAGGGDRTCHCKGSCSGVNVAAECRPSGPMGVVCSCFVDGTEVLACDDFGPACGLAEGCCGPIFEELR
ncbi:hypothetical protein WME76_25305 [Sorangium sp. So ce119]|uniref:hypothetical protein n=1 Tax=Sorangium sp. So ce119 TaxID=3133279 RepID=UPI003F5E6DDC